MDQAKQNIRQKGKKGEKVQKKQNKQIFFKRKIVK